MVPRLEHVAVRVPEVPGEADVVDRVARACGGAGDHGHGLGQGERHEVDDGLLVETHEGERCLSRRVLGDPHGLQAHGLLVEAGRGDRLPHQRTTWPRRVVLSFMHLRLVSRTTTHKGLAGRAVRQG